MGAKVNYKLIKKLSTVIPRNCEIDGEVLEELSKRNNNTKELYLIYVDSGTKSELISQKRFAWYDQS